MNNEVEVKKDEIEYGGVGKEEFFLNSISNLPLRYQYSLFIIPYS